MRQVREQARLAALYASRLLLPGGPPALPAPRRILAIRPDHLGDLLLTTPALRLIKQRLPESHLGLLVGPWNVEAAAGITGVDEVLTIPFPWFDRKPGGNLLAPYRQIKREAARLAEAGWDTAALFRHDHWWGAMLAAFAGIPRRAGYATREAAPFLTDTLPYEPCHEALQAFRLAQFVTGAAGSDRPGDTEFSPGLEDRNRASAWLEQRGIHAGFMVIHPGAGAPVKRWNPENFSRLTALLASETAQPIVLTAGPEEEHLVAQIAGSVPHRTAVLAGASLGMVAAILKQAGLAIGVDSGIMHLAAAVGTSTVRLYGPVDPARFGPWGPEGHHRVVRASPACVPCDRLDFAPRDLPFHPCVRSISVEAVVREVLALLPAEIRPAG